MNRSKRALAAACAAVFCVSTGLASAASVPSSQSIATGFGSTTWYVSDQGGTGAGPFSGSCSGGPGLVITDASGPTGASDAYDHAWVIFVNGVPYSVGPTVDLTGTTYTGPASLMSGLNVSVQYHFVPGDAVARILVTLQNPGASAVAVPVQVSNNWGSDSTTTIRATSSGDAVVGTDDRWIITSDSYGPSDPVNLSVMYGEGAGVVPAAYTTTVFGCAGAEGLGTTFNMNVPAGQTQRLMMFAGLGGVMENNNTVLSAQASASFFASLDSLDPAWIVGVGQAELDSIVNWGPAAPAFSSCAGEGYVGDQFKLCQVICSSSLTGKPITPLIRLWTSTYGADPLCPSATAPLLVN
ncbi:hypothetical protein [Arenimonas sp.]|uniref:hypothetical protein n=1 Tax=Arenimonas sp. TaxID=1872635 RepID=UPI0035B3F3E4